MPVLPDVASRIVRPAVSWPEASPSRIIRAAARSFTDPPGFCHSAFAYSSTPGVSRSNWCSRTSGVRPIMSRTEDPGERSRTDVVSDEDIPIYDRMSPDFINLTNPVKLTAIRADANRHHDPARRLALSASDGAAPSRRGGHSGPPGRRGASIGRACGGRRRDDRVWRVAARVGGAPHRGDFAHAKRPARPARGERSVRPASKPALPRQYRAVGRLRARRATGMAGARHPRAARPRVPRDREMGRRAAGVAFGRRLSRLRRPRPALGTYVQAQRLQGAQKYWSL